MLTNIYVVKGISSPVHSEVHWYWSILKKFISYAIYNKSSTTRTLTRIILLVLSVTIDALGENIFKSTYVLILERTPLPVRYVTIVAWTRGILRDTCGIIKTNKHLLILNVTMEEMGSGSACYLTRGKNVLCALSVSIRVPPVLNLRHIWWLPLVWTLSTVYKCFILLIFLKNIFLILVIYQHLNSLKILPLVWTLSTV